MAALPPVPVCPLPTSHRTAPRALLPRQRPPTRSPSPSVPLPRHAAAPRSPRGLGGAVPPQPCRLPHRGLSSPLTPPRPCPTARRRRSPCCRPSLPPHPPVVVAGHRCCPTGTSAGVGASGVGQPSLRRRSRSSSSRGGRVSSTGVWGWLDPCHGERIW
ncbi:hypothetical protein BS78_08G051300 [Paspalum vaginatum]|nr:hypothetical protein BS78_08G051300 [Paspalum vaginatum]KAJ1265086.1 hypothetical protein BS78_08G051300 [Paspalum vaginatum]